MIRKRRRTRGGKGTGEGKNQREGTITREGRRTWKGEGVSKDLKAELCRHIQMALFASWWFYKIIELE